MPALPGSEGAALPILDRVMRGQRVSRDEGYTLMNTAPSDVPALLEVAGALRDRGHGREVTFSAKVFVPLTTLCRDYCGYCTFRRDPGEPGGRTMEIDEVVDLCLAGHAVGAKEALFSLGDRPEAIFSEHRAWLAARGERTTLGYLRAACEAVTRKTDLLPHANPGLMGDRDLADLKEVNASMGLMLESTSERLLEPGGAHDRAPDKVPRHRLRTIENAGELRIPFTSGILIGIGETLDERVDALVALRDLHERYGHIQEIIVQNFRAKPTIRMKHQPDPSFDDLQKTLAVARIIVGPRMNLQAPPNLSPDTFPALIRAGLNDWGGISPLTVDHINPEAPWPHLRALREQTQNAGHELRERLAVYPEYIVGDGGFLPAAMRERALAYTDARGLVKGEFERWRAS
ncbi:MAG TPA: 7,8-didemethyl-8-hydroxy-5-deazariboflavin synthase CofG [Polyangiaceae bacterium]|nr:7,8-didemethyl-8-hydroxy-5-deazariboflavin synthase CofG [Polyangiaceae bacterium]